MHLASVLVEPSLLYGGPVPIREACMVRLSLDPSLPELCGYSVTLLPTTYNCHLHKWVNEMEY